MVTQILFLLNILYIVSFKSHDWSVKLYDYIVFDDIIWLFSPQHWLLWLFRTKD